MSFYVITVLILFFFSILFAAAVNHAKGFGASGRFEKIERLVLVISKIPFDALNIITNKRFKINEHKNKKKGINTFVQDKESLSGYLLLPIYDLDRKISKIDLYDINNNVVIHSWNHKIDSINKISKLDRNLNNLERDHNSERFMVRHPLLLENGDIVFTAHRTPLVRIDKCSNLIWYNDNYFHHSIENDNNGFIWSHLSNRNIEFNNELISDDLIVKVDLETGEIVYKKSIIEILLENNLKDLITSSYVGVDPLHSNDVQPVLFDGKYWKKGDVFISLRHISMAMLYRPSNNKVIWHKQGPWRYNHDIDIIDEKTIALFNNNNKLNGEPPDESNVLFYNFETKTVENPYEKLFDKTKFSSEASGLFTMLENEDIIVEETVKSRIIRGNKEGVIKWEFIWDSLLNWSRFINKGEYNDTINILKNSKC